MATKTPVDAAEVFLTPAEVEQQRKLALQQADEEMTPEDRVRQMMQDIRDDQSASIKVYRRNGVKTALCRGYTIEEFEDGNFADRVRTEWGPGQYEIRMYNSRGLVRGVTLALQPPLQTLVQPNSGTSELAQMLASMAQQQQQTFELIARMAQQPVAPPVDPMDQLQKMMQLMALMKQVTASEVQKPQSQITEIVAAIKELKAVSAEINPSTEEKEPSMMQMAGQLLPLLQQGIANNQNAAPQPIALPPTFAQASPPIYAMPDISAPVQVPPELRESAETEVNNQQTQTSQLQQDDEVNALQKLALYSLLQKLTAMAEKKTEVKEAADLILDKAPDEVIDFLETPEWWQALVGAVPAVAPHKEWFEKVREAVIAGLEEESDDTPSA